MISKKRPKYQLLDHAKKSETDSLKIPSKSVIQRTAEADSISIGNKIVDKITNISKNLQQNKSKSITNKHDKEIPKERYKSSEEKQKVIDDLRLI